MIRRIGVILILVAACGLAAAQQLPPSGPQLKLAEASDAVRFVPIEVLVDPAPAPGDGAALAAWQFDLTCDDPAVRIAGIEGSDHVAFNHPPYYDAAAMRGNRVIAASYKVAPADQLPNKKLRVATVMVSIPAGSTPTVTLHLTATADSDGQPLPRATATIQEGTVR